MQERKRGISALTKANKIIARCAKLDSNDKYQKVMVLVNLKPATLAGIVSEGMLLCAEDENGELALMTPEKNMPSGAEIC